MLKVIPGWTGQTGPVVTETNPLSSDLPEWAAMKAAYPKDKPVTSRTLALQVAISSRLNLSNQCGALSRGALLEHHTTSDWLSSIALNAPDYYIYGSGLKPRIMFEEALHLVELNIPLEKSLRALCDALAESTEPLRKFQDRQLLDIATDQKRIELNPEFAKAAKKMPQQKDSAVTNKSTLDAEGDAIKLSLHGDRDEAFRQSETAKWKAIRKAAEEILMISHAADCLLPYLPDRVKNQKSRHRDPARGVIEDKTRDLILGGTGGWVIKVENTDDWIPIDAQALGVPEDDTVSRDDGLSIAEQMYQDRMMNGTH
ncbi:uncharacterized protein I303_105232 [Kwoniella dejecticola CBS 10117]|uniref:Uncharacterized protein n=1 Tax=Kwoniella dejecticola CBS 10117 TaxID=1296121 RepID=A0AAJ8KSA1_9TREE